MQKLYNLLSYTNSKISDGNKPISENMFQKYIRQ